MSLTPSENSSLCDLKPVCARDGFGFVDCQAKNALCVLIEGNSSFVSYDCICKPGQHMVNDICVDHCNDPEITDFCSSKNTDCDPTEYLNSNYVKDWNRLCKCKLGFHQTSPDLPCTFELSTYTFELLVSNLTYTNSHLYKSLYKMDQYLTQESKDFANLYSRMSNSFGSRNLEQLIKDYSQSMDNNQMLIKESLDRNTIYYIQTIVNKDLHLLFSGHIKDVQSNCSVNSDNAYYNCTIVIIYNADFDVHPAIDSFKKSCRTLNDWNGKPTVDCFIRVQLPESFSNQTSEANYLILNQNFTDETQVELFNVRIQ